MAPRSKRTLIKGLEDTTGPPLMVGTPSAMRRMSRETTTSRPGNSEPTTTASRSDFKVQDKETRRHTGSRKVVVSCTRNGWPGGGVQSRHWARCGVGEYKDRLSVGSASLQLSTVGRCFFFWSNVDRRRHLWEDIYGFLILEGVRKIGVGFKRVIIQEEARKDGAIIWRGDLYCCPRLP